MAKLSRNMIRKMIKEALDSSLEIKPMPDSPQMIAQAMLAGLKKGTMRIASNGKGDILFYPYGPMHDAVIILRSDKQWRSRGFMSECSGVMSVAAEIDAARSMSDEEAGPKKVKKMKEYEDGIHLGVTSLVDVIGIDTEDDE